MQGLGRDLTEIAGLLIGVAFVALLVGHSTDAAKLIKQTSDSFGGLLQIVTLQNQFGNPLSSGF